MCACAMLLLLASCQQRTVYHHYEHTPLTGWEKNDTLSFITDSMPANGNYQEDIGLRVSAAYPFKGLCLVVEQKVLPSNKVRIDTLNCSLADEQGNAMGHGISHYQYLFPLATLSLNKGERLHVTIRHDMKREILPGIADIGIRLTAN